MAVVKHLKLKLNDIVPSLCYNNWEGAILDEIKFCQPFLVHAVGKPDAIRIVIPTPTACIWFGPDSKTITYLSGSIHSNLPFLKEHEVYIRQLKADDFVGFSGY